MVTEPELGSMSPLRILRRVVFPEPLAPVGWNTYTEHGPVYIWGKLWRDEFVRVPLPLKSKQQTPVGKAKATAKKGKTFTEDSYVETPDHARPSYERSQSSRPPATAKQQKAAAAIKKSLRVAQQKKLAAIKAQLKDYKGRDDSDV